MNRVVIYVEEANRIAIISNGYSSQYTATIARNSTGSYPEMSGKTLL